MRRDVKTAILGIAAVLVLALPLSAQDAPEPPRSMGALESNTYKATAGLFGTDVDSYMDVHSFPDVKFDKWFAFISGDNVIIPKMTGGYGRKFENFYLGTWYQGNFFRHGDGVESSVVTPTYDDVNKTLTQTVNTKSYDADSWIESANQLEILLGIAGHGIKLGFYEAMTQNKLPGSSDRDFTVTDYKNGLKTYTDEVDEYSRVLGYLRPYLGWGSTFGLAGGEIYPYAKFALNIYQDKLIDNTKSYDTLSGKKTGTVTENKYAGQQAGYVEPAFTVGAAYAFPENGKPDISVGLEYIASFRTYDNDYSASGIKGSVAGPVSWEDGSITTNNFLGQKVTTTTASLSFQDTTNSSHLITPSFFVSDVFSEGLKMGLYLEVPIGINVSSVNAYGDDYIITKTKSNTGNKADNRDRTEKTHYNNGLTDTTSVSIGADLSLGFSCPLIRDRFTVNGGISISPFVWTRTTTKVAPNGVAETSSVKESDGNKVVITDTINVVDSSQASDSVAVENTWTALSGQVSGGFVFYFGNHTAIDMLVSQIIGENFGLEATSFNLMFTVTF